MNISVLLKMKRKGKRHANKKKGNSVELQQTALECIVEMQELCADHPRAKAITNCVAEMMGTNLYSML